MKTSTYQGEIKNVTAALEAVWQFLKKLNTSVYGVFIKWHAIQPHTHKNRTIDKCYNAD